MLTDILLLLGGFALLIAGGETLVRGAVGLAKAMGVSTLIIGLTVVAFGTSAPELAVNVIAALEGNSGISYGNIVGSNIANVGLILGITAMVRAVDVHSQMITREMPIMLGATFLLIALTLDKHTGMEATDQLSRLDGAIMLAGFVLFMLFTIRTALKQRKSDAMIKEMAEETESQPDMAIWLAGILTIFGLAGVIYGGKITVDGAVGIARAIGMSDVVIGLTIVAIGTSLPELVTCVTAVRRGHTDLAVGNVVGSNIWNIMLILAVTATVNPIPVPEGGMTDLWVMTALSIAILPLAIFGTTKVRRTLGRGKGLIFVSVYVGYLTWRTIMALS